MKNITAFALIASITVLACKDDEPVQTIAELGACVHACIGDNANARRIYDGEWDCALRCQSNDACHAECDPPIERLCESDAPACELQDRCDTRCSE